MHLADCKDQTESDCKLTHVSSVDSVRHLENLKKFDALFNAEKANFNFSQDSTYYLISTRFLNCWRDFCTSHSPMRLWPTAVNEDLFEGGMPNLRPGLVEKEDFEIVSE